MKTIVKKGDVYRKILKNIGEPSYNEFKLDKDLEKKARLLEIAGDPTRIRILCLMFKYGRACVSEIAGGLGMSIASISHHLQIMKDNGYFVTEREGNTICYILENNDLVRKLKSLICG